MIRVEVCPSSKTVTFTKEGIKEINLKKAKKILNEQGFTILKETKDLLVGIRMGSCAYVYRISVLRSGKILVKTKESELRAFEKIAKIILGD